MAAHNELGKWGEDIASEYLIHNGYQIVERDWKSGRRDIDIIATDGNRLSSLKSRPAATVSMETMKKQ